MAKQIARLLRSELTVSDELSKIAKLLQSKGRGKDTILAHITPKEAELLKKLGGSGTKNPETGLLEFQGGDEGIEMGADLAPEQRFTPEQDYAQEVAPDAQYALPSPATVGVSPEAKGVTGFRAEPQAFVPTPVSAGREPTYVPPTLTAPQIAPTPTAAAPKDFTDKLKDYLSDPANLAKLGLGIGGAGLGAMRARQGAKQIQAATEEQKALGVPYQTQGRELVRAAQAGELTPTSSQAYQAMQAQLAQSQATRGGVGTAQAAAQLEAFRQQLLQNQYTYGLQVANIGDQYVSGAIRTGLQLDQQLQQATSNFYTNLAAVAGGLPVARTTTTA